MLKDTLLLLGLVLGTLLTIVGGALQLFRGDNSDADAMAAAVRYFLGLSALVVGLMLLLICAWVHFR